MFNLCKITLTMGMLLVMNVSLSASSDGEKLFKEKCMICHTMTRPADMSQMVAPPAKGIMYHMSEAFESKEEILAHINSFTMNPTKEKAVCRGVRRFGLMPSQKDNITQDELNSVAVWMIDNLNMSKQEHGKRKNKSKGNCKK